MLAFSLSAQFARESAMLKVPEERREEMGRVKGSGEGARREKRKRLPKNTVEMRNTP